MSDPVTKDADQSEAADSQTEASTLSAVEAKLSAMRGESEVVDDDPVVKEDESEPTDRKDSEEVVPDKDDAEPKKKDDDLPVLPSGHRRAALARGWTNEEVDHYLEIKPEEATAKLGELFDDWQKQNSLWSERGRQLRNAEPKAPEGEKAEGKETSEALSHYDVKTLVEDNPGQEDLINALVTPLNAVIDRVNAAAEKLSSSEEFLQGTKETALAGVIQDFLASKEMEPYKETYGEEIKNLTDEQFKSRMELFEQADIIVAGATAHGVDLTTREALERAQMIVSQGTRDEAIRQGIRESMKKRTKTTRSSHQQTLAPEGDQPVTEEELVKRTEKRLQELRSR